MNASRQAAYWQERTHVFDDTDYKCSVCGAVYDVPYDTCPNCGTRIAGVESDPDWAMNMAIMDDLINE